MTPPSAVPPETATRLYEQAGAVRWRVARERWTQALEASAGRAFAGRHPSSDEIDRYVVSLHLEDLALACACIDGDEAAWEHVITTLRPALTRAADAIDPTGRARDVAESLFGELFGVREKDGVRQSLLRHFHGRSSLATWLRAVLAQRHIDVIRASRKLDPLPEDPAQLPAPARTDSDPNQIRYEHLMRTALTSAIRALLPRDRLRLSCYYAQQLTLAAIGRLLGEHEGTVSRHLTRTRADLREHIERVCRDDCGLDDRQIAECFTSMINDSGNLDLMAMLSETDTANTGGGKKPSLDRSR